MAVCERTGITHVQLHGPEARKALFLLHADYKKFYVQPVSPQGFYDPKEIPELSPQDYVLFDNEKAGKGIAFDWEHFKYPGPFSMGFAGGLNTNNVCFAIRKFHPALVDVSGGVENTCGKKDFTLIREFIKAVTGACND